VTLAWAIVAVRRAAALARTALAAYREFLNRAGISLPVSASRVAAIARSPFLDTCVTPFG
jgi:hypothetical protein